MAAMAKSYQIGRRRQSLSRRLLAEPGFCLYLAAVKWLTKQEQWVIAATAGLLLVGLVVKYWRMHH
jgi:hypothetical protein